MSDPLEAFNMLKEFQVSVNSLGMASPDASDPASMLNSIQPTSNGVPSEEPPRRLASDLLSRAQAEESEEN